jgi:hypothetical protein
VQWYNEIDPEQLCKDKVIDLIHCDSEINKYIPNYWQPFLPYLSHLVKATWPKLNPFSNHAAGTHSAFRDILKEALTDLITNHSETKCNYACITVPAKHTQSQATGVSRYPYKIRQGDHTQHHPQLSSIKPLTVWKDSVDYRKLRRGFCLVGTVFLAHMFSHYVLPLVASSLNCLPCISFLA